MRRAAILGVLAMAGCAAPVVTRGPVDTGAVPVTVGGQDFVADLHGGGSGTRLTEDGALPTTGLAVTVTRAAPLVAADRTAAAPDGIYAPRSVAPFGDADGRLAKGAAQAGCAASGGRFDTAAIGRVSALGRWTFEGACS